VSNWEFEVEEGTESDEYVLSASNTTRKMTITIPDITSIEDLDLTKEVVITVIYNAHLNEDAVVSNSETCEVDDGGDGTYDNNRNTVYLEYSNKPDASGSTDTGNLGKTPDDTVYVFTYEMPNTKVDADDNPVEGAGFKLYESDGTTEIGLIKDTTLDAYRPIKSGETKEEMFSADDTGIFNIVGLDAGTYILKETTIPDGYNKCADITVVISGTHVENQDKASATDTFSMTMNGVASTNNKIVNNVGATLPETGGIGTTIFYVLGGLLMAGAVILLVTKKKMSVEQE
ncbi:MAG: LPXTG cell wall anchor domain-containing protein, partial [Firmicutes bacterium]|nr:LPXTG cell wall anchor domain-containing protein [Bacillota bacterium]